MQRNIPEIDGLRAMAVLAVLAIHVNSGRVPGGFLGVNLFFVLSGFLITRLLTEELKATGGIDFRAFYLKRALRILPPLCVAIALAWLLWPSGRPFAPVLAPVLLFYANLVDAGSLSVLTPTWSLAVEEQFYIAWPVIIAICASQRRGHLLWILAAIMLGSCLLRAILLSTGFQIETAYRLTPTRMDDLAAGCFAALWVSTRGVPKWVTPGVVSAVAVVLCAMFILVKRDPFLFMTAGFSATAILSAVLVVGTASGRLDPALRAVLASRAAVYLGRRSYGIYLYHFPIFVALEPLRAYSSPLNFVLVTCLRLLATVIVAEVSYWTIERWARSARALLSKRGQASGRVSEAPIAVG